MSPSHFGVRNRFHIHSAIDKKDSTYFKFYLLGNLLFLISGNVLHTLKDISLLFILIFCYCFFCISKDTRTNSHISTVTSRLTAFKLLKRHSFCLYLCLCSRNCDEFKAEIYYFCSCRIYHSFLSFIHWNSLN